MLRVRSLLLVSLLVAIVWLNEGAQVPLTAQEDSSIQLHLPWLESGLTPSAIASPTSTASPTPTTSPTATATPTASPTLTPTPTLPPGTPQPSAWNQHAHNAQRTSYAPVSVPTPWRLQWVWNGSDAAGRVAAGKFGLPRNSQPVTGGGRVYIAAGSRGVYALARETGAVLWNRTFAAAANSTPAYDPATGALFVVTTDGVLHKLNAATGVPQAQFAAAGSSSLPLPPALLGDTVYFSMGSGVYALSTTTLVQRWRYEAGSPVDTPPAISAAQSLVVVASRDLFVHAIRTGDGSRAWRTKTTPRTGGDPGGTSQFAEVANGWPVIAEQQGLVLVKLRLDWQSLWTLSPWPAGNAAMRAALLAQPDQQALLVLRLSDGSQAFIANVGHGGFGDGDYLPMGPMPVVKQVPDGRDLAYVVMRGSPCLADPCDGRWDSRLGELLLDDDSVPGYGAGDVRYMENTFFPTDEQAYLSMAGDDLFAAHWEAGIAHRIVDRSPARGSGAQPILTALLPHIATSQDEDVCGTGFDSSRFCAAGLRNTRPWPGGFYIYWQEGNVYDQFWSEYAAWVISEGQLLYVSTDGAVVALTHGTPAAGVAAAGTRTDAPTVVTGASTGARPVIPVTAARAYAGQTAVVEGTPVEVFSNGKALYLGFTKPHRGGFVVRIPVHAWANFPAAPATLYAPGRALRIQGRIGWYQGAPTITVTDPAQIEFTARE